ncbi:MAG: hypothetical protein M9958_01455 [Chitinophagales bacterium]|nr:hypothetical protein [Chitinophagales bacterium]
MMSKPIILTNFGYNRKNWIEPLELLSDEFTVVYIHFVSKLDENACFTNAKKLYFSDFRSAQELIDTVQPDIFIAMGLESSYIYAIKHVCNMRKIPFVYMDHGLYGHPQDYINEKIAVKGRTKLEEQSKQVDNAFSKRTSNYNFFLNTFLSTFSLINIIQVLFLLFQQKVRKKTLDNNKFYIKLSRPDAFLTYSALNFTFNREIYHPNSEDVFYIGNFEYDKFRVVPNRTDEDAYLLFIDNAISDNPFNKFYISTDEHVLLYNKMRSLAQMKNLKLKIKLHPYNYYSQWLPQLDDTEFIKDCNVNDLIKNANCCVSFRSTLLIPALYFVPTVILKIYNNSIEDFMEDNDICNIYCIDNLNIDNIIFPEKVASDNDLFVEYFFDLKKDNSITRLKKAIITLIERFNT